MARIIPNTPLFIVTSALNPNMGVINRDDRLQQTIDGLKSLREKCPDAIVLLADGSPEKVEEDKIKALDGLAHFVADFSGDNDITQFAATGRKSEAENVLMLKTLLLLKQDPGMMRLLQTVNRVFKLSARTTIDDDFDISEHNHFGKYVFKKRMPTWIQGERAEVFTDLLITRLFSFCPSLLDDYFIMCKRNINVIMETGVDTEHAHFFNIGQENLIELNIIHCRGIMAGTGTLEIY
jgi:hypothetical protein